MSHSTTILLPSGRKLRSQTQRRFILVYDGDRHAPSIERRSDDPAKLRKLRFAGTVIIDTVTGAVIQ